MKVFINPGHAPDGNPDPGALNHNGARECDYTARAGALLASYLNIVGMETKILQSDDLGEVCAASNEWGANIFVSLHCNAFNKKARGAETLYKSMNGQRLANFIQSQLIRSIGDLVDRGAKQEDHLWVLNGTDAVSVLVEMAFIDNDEDLAILDNKMDTIVRAIARGITDYVS